MTDRDHASRFIWKASDIQILKQGDGPSLDEPTVSVWPEKWIADHPDELDRIGPTDRIIPDGIVFFVDDAEKYPLWPDWRREHGI